MFQYGVIGCVLFMCAHTACAPSSDVDRMQDFLDHVKGPVAPVFEAQSPESYWDMKTILPDKELLFVQPDIRQLGFDDPKAEEDHRGFAIQQISMRAPMFPNLTHNAVHFMQRQDAFIDASISALKARRRYVFYKNIFMQYEALKKDVSSLESDDLSALMMRADLVKRRAEAFIRSLDGDVAGRQSEDVLDPHQSSRLRNSPVQDETLSDLLTSENVFFEDPLRFHVPPPTPEEGQEKSELTTQECLVLEERNRLIQDFLNCHSENQALLQDYNDTANAQDRIVRGYMTYVEEHCPHCDTAPLYYQDWLAQQ